jgi:hypothetical protein
LAFDYHNIFRAVSSFAASPHDRLARLARVFNARNGDTPASGSVRHRACLVWEITRQHALSTTSSDLVGENETPLAKHGRAYWVGLMF